MQQRCNLHCAVLMCHLQNDANSIFGAWWWQFLKSLLLIFKLFSQSKFQLWENSQLFLSLQLAFIMRLLILQVCAIFSVRALENPIPSSFLQPRNFNPHPYQAEASKYLLAPGQYEDYHGLGLTQNYQELSRKIQKFVLTFICDNLNKILFLSPARVRYNFLRITTARPRVNRKNKRWSNEEELCHILLRNKHWYHIHMNDWHWIIGHNNFTDILEM